MWAFVQQADAHDDFALAGELDGVVDQVGQDLPDAHRVAGDRHRQIVWNVTDHFESFALGRLGKQVRDILDQLAEVEVDALDLQLAGFDLGEIEDVIDDVQQMLAGLVDGIGEASLLRTQRRVAQQLGHAQNTVHRGADFVAHRRQEFALRPAAGFRKIPGLAQIGGLERQVKVAILDSSQHDIEALGQFSDLVAGLDPCPGRVVTFLRHSHHHREQIRDRRHDAAVSPEKKCQKGKHHEHRSQCCHPGQAAQVGRGGFADHHAPCLHVSGQLIALVDQLAEGGHRLVVVRTGCSHPAESIGGAAECFPAGRDGVFDPCLQIGIVGGRNQFRERSIEVEDALLGLFLGWQSAFGEDYLVKGAQGQLQVDGALGGRCNHCRTALHQVVAVCPGRGENDSDGQRQHAGNDQPTADASFSGEHVVGVGVSVRPGVPWLPTRQSRRASRARSGTPP